MASDAPRLFKVSAGIFALAFTLLTTHARGGEPSVVDRETARARMDQGHDARAHGDMRAALESFRAADELMHVPSTGIEVARSLADLGRLVEAITAARAILQIPVTNDEPQPFIQARRDAEQLIASLDGRIPTLAIRVVSSSPNAASVTLDGVAVPMTSPRLERRLDPGRHTVTASSQGHDVHREIVLAERETRELTFDLEPAVLAASAEGDPPPPPPRSHALLYVGASMGGAGLVAGVTTGILALVHRDDALTLCSDNRCPPAAHSDVNAARAFGVASTIAFAAAGIGAGLVIFDLTRPHATTSTSVAVDARGVQLRGAF